MEFDAFLSYASVRFEDEYRQQQDALVSDLVDIETKDVSLASRIIAHASHPLAGSLIIYVRGGRCYQGTIVDCAQNWLLIAEVTGHILIPLSGISAVQTLRLESMPCIKLRHRMSFAFILRQLKNEDCIVKVTHDGGTHEGCITQVMSDHFDLSTGNVYALDSRDQAEGPVISLSFIGVLAIQLMHL